MDYNIFVAWFVLWIALRIPMFINADRNNYKMAHRLRRIRGIVLIPFGIGAYLLGGNLWWLGTIPLGLVLALASDEYMKDYVEKFAGVVPVAKVSGVSGEEVHKET